MDNKYYSKSQDPYTYEYIYQKYGNINQVSESNFYKKFLFNLKKNKTLFNQYKKVIQLLKWINK